MPNNCGRRQRPLDFDLVTEMARTEENIMYRLARILRYVISISLFLGMLPCPVLAQTCPGTKKLYKGGCWYPSEINGFKERERQEALRKQQEEALERERAAREERARMEERARRRAQEEAEQRAREERVQLERTYVVGKVHDFEVIECGTQNIKATSGQRHWSRGQILVDGSVLGLTNRTVKVLPGIRTFTIRSQIFTDHEEVVEVRPGGSFEIKPKGYARTSMVPECLALAGLSFAQPQEEQSAEFSSGVSSETSTESNEASSRRTSAIIWTGAAIFSIGVMAGGIVLAKSDYADEMERNSTGEQRTSSAEAALACGTIGAVLGGLAGFGLSLYAIDKWIDVGKVASSSNATRLAKGHGSTRGFSLGIQVSDSQGAVFLGMPW